MSPQQSQTDTEDDGSSLAADLASTKHTPSYPVLILTFEFVPVTALPLEPEYGQQIIYSRVYEDEQYKYRHVEVPKPL